MSHSIGRILIEFIGVLAGIVTILSYFNGVPPSVHEPTITSFEATPSHIISGDGTTLTWHTSDATHVTITPGIGNVALNGEIFVNPTKSTTYTLTATNEAGEDSVTGFVTVEPPQESTIESFEANPTSVISGRSTTLTWSVSGATRVTITPGIGDVALSGSISVSPTESTTYTLTATNEAGDKSVSRYVAVTENNIFDDNSNTGNSYNSNYNNETSDAERALTDDLDYFSNDTTNNDSSNINNSDTKRSLDKDIELTFRYFS